MSLRERVEKWWTMYPSEPIGSFIGLWTMMLISAQLFPVILTEMP